MNKKVVTILIIVLALGLGFFGWQYVLLRGQLQTAEQSIASQQINKKVLVFSQLFVTNVLQGSKEVSFDDRLQLENAMRDIKDPELFAAWQKFTGAKDQAEIQQQFSNLFQLLLKKISTQG